MSTLKPIYDIGKGISGDIEDVIAAYEALGMKVVLVGDDTQQIQKLYRDDDSAKLIKSIKHVDNAGRQKNPACANLNDNAGDSMEHVHDIHNKIAAHDTFNQLLEKKLMWVKVEALLMVFLLCCLFHSVIHLRGIVFMTAFIPLLCIVIAARYVRSLVVMTGAEIWQYLDVCNHDEDFARIFIPLLLNLDYLTQFDDDILTQYLLDRHQQERDASACNSLK